MEKQETLGCGSNQNLLNRGDDTLYVNPACLHEDHKVPRSPNDLPIYQRSSTNQLHMLLTSTIS